MRNANALITFQFSAQDLDKKVKETIALPVMTTTCPLSSASDLDTRSVSIDAVSVFGLDVPHCPGHIWQERPLPAAVPRQRRRRAHRDVQDGGHHEDAEPDVARRHRQHAAAVQRRPVPQRPHRVLRLGTPAGLAHRIVPTAGVLTHRHTHSLSRFFQNKDGRHDFIGSCTTSVDDLLRRATSGERLALINPAMKSKSKYLNSGLLRVNSLTVTPRPSFLDFVTGGCEISFMVRQRRWCVVRCVLSCTVVYCRVLSLCCCRCVVVVVVSLFLSCAVL